MEQLQPQPHDEASFNAMESFRFYENDFPETDEIVMVRVDRLTETFAYVQLLEYNNLEGIIQFSELSKTRLKSPLKFLKIGKQDEMQVLRVDEEKGYVDLTMKHLNKADEEECQERFRQSKAVDSILRHISVTHRQPLEMLYRNIAWPLARNEKYSHPLEALKSSIKEDTSVLDELQLDPDIKKELLRVITRRFQKDNFKTQAQIEITCFGRDGIKGIIPALQAAKSSTTMETHVEVSVISPPLYLLEAFSKSQEDGISTLTLAIEAAKFQIEKYEGGSLNIKVQPTFISV